MLHILAADLKDKTEQTDKCVGEGRGSRWRKREGGRGGRERWGKGESESDEEVERER